MRTATCWISGQRCRTRLAPCFAWVVLGLAPWPMFAQGTGGPASHVVVFTAHDYAFEVPGSFPAGLTTVVVRNKGKEDHEVVLYRLEAGKTLSDLLRALASDQMSDTPAWAIAVGGPGEAIPGGESNATLLLSAGHYVALCGVPAADGKSHFLKGMVKDLTVTPSPAATPLPESDVTITMVDDSFQVTGLLKAGPHRFRVTNAGMQGHMMQIVRLAPGKTVADYVNWDPASKSPNPIEWSGGVSYMAPGHSAYFGARLRPGEYAIACFIDDVTDHKPHFAHGMQKQFTVR